MRDYPTLAFKELPYHVGDFNSKVVIHCFPNFEHFVVQREQHRSFTHISRFEVSERIKAESSHLCSFLDPFSHSPAVCQISRVISAFVSCNQRCNFSACDMIAISLLLNKRRTTCLADLTSVSIPSILANSLSNLTGSPVSSGSSITGSATPSG